MNGMIQQKAIDVAGVVIAQDQAGRYCLNDLHKAAGGEPKHRPPIWLENQQTKDLIAEIVGDLGDAGNPAPVSIVRGRFQGTYASKELVYAYAMWISPRFHLKVIRTFDAVATGQLKAPVATPVEATKVFRALFGIGRLIGLDKNAAAISANQGTNTTTGTNMLQLMGQTHLTAEVQELCFTPTELGARLCMSGMKFNQRLSERGMQANINGQWVPTDKGQAYSRILDTGKKSGAGTPIQQVKWLDSVMSEVAL